MKRIGLSMVLGLVAAGALAAGVNEALIVATNKLTLPTNGTVTVTLTSRAPGAPMSFNLFQYNTVTNYDAERWTVELPPRSTDGEVLNDSDAKLIYLTYRFQTGAVILVR